ncbi:MAG TPA: peptide-methionine (R)-S-oxide reductase MsrB [Salinimicrobium sp.]|nr:peptide-methionine (R)-S-oxide reductase MsrB [Salinimicrobium sp.]
MFKMKRSALAIYFLIAGLSMSCGWPQNDTEEVKEEFAEKTANEVLENPVDADTITVGNVEKSQEQWKEILEPAEYEILREGGTEPAFLNEYYDNKEEGIYYCGACGLPVYSSKTKFHSGTGWPSFWAPIDPKLVKRQPDRRFSMTRTEVVCAQCGSHFGHIFPNPTVPSGERHCLNSLALDFKPKDI